MAREEPKSVEAAAEWLRKRFRAEASQELRARFVIELTGAQGGCLHGCIDEGAFEVAVEDAETVDLRLRARAADFYALLAGRENAEMLFMADRIAIDGDLALALRIRRLFRAKA